LAENCALKAKTKRVLAKLKYLNERLFYRPNQFPIIVLGNQKSGTSAVANLLADYGCLSRTIDIRELWQPTIGRILQGEQRFKDFVRCYPRPFSCDLIKEPLLTFIYEEVKQVFPSARYVLVVRDPRDNVRSFLNRMRIPGDLVFLDVNDWNIPTLWLRAFDAVLWRTQSSHYIDMLAERWNSATDVFLQQQHEIQLIRYEEFVLDKIGSIADLAARLDVKAKADIHTKVDIQYQPKGQRNVTWLEFFGQENLWRIENICGERMLKLGYGANGEVPPQT